MRFSTLCGISLAFTLSGIGIANCLAEDPVGTPNPGVPELKVLNRFAGSWEAKVGDSGDDNVIVSKRGWVLDGRFLKHDFNLSNGDVSGVIYRGYDQNKKRYVMTVMESSGSASLLAGYWSEERKTLTLESLGDSGLIQKYESYFPDDNTEQWTISFSSGDNVGEITGTARRKQ